MKRILTTILMCLATSPAWALSLGDIEVRSLLNEPLDAVVPVITIREGETYNLNVRLASEADHLKRNIQLSNAARGIQVFLVDDPQSAPYLRVVTTQPVREPALNFMLDANFKGGRVLRNYKVLLNIRN